MDQCPAPEAGVILGYVLGWSSRWALTSMTIMDPVELDWLETFLAVVDRGGFTAASAQVHRSQSRVSAHIAALEREVGVRLIDRGHRPATVTDAGRVFADHARAILEDVRIARSALSAIRSLSDQSVHVRTDACLGASLFPPVLIDVLTTFPDATVTVTSRERNDDQPAEQALMTVAPADRPPHPEARREVLWWEPLQLLMADDHRWEPAPARIEPFRRDGQRLVMGAAAARVIDEAAARTDESLPAPARIVVDPPQTLAGLVRAGLGVGVSNPSAIATTDLAGLVVLPYAGAAENPPLGFDVAVDWFDVLLTSPVGRALHEAVLAAPPPAGAVGRRPHR